MESSSLQGGWRFGRDGGSPTGGSAATLGGRHSSGWWARSGTAVRPVWDRWQVVVALPFKALRRQRANEFQGGGFGAGGRAALAARGRVGAGFLRESGLMATGVSLGALCRDSGLRRVGGLRFSEAAVASAGVAAGGEERGPQTGLFRFHWPVLRDRLAGRRSGDIGGGLAVSGNGSREAATKKKPLTTVTGQGLERLLGARDVPFGGRGIGPIAYVPWRSLFFRPYQRGPPCATTICGAGLYGAQMLCLHWTPPIEHSRQR